MRDVAQSLGYRKSDIRVLLDHEATEAGIKRAFQDWIIDGVGSGDSALFYFSGHGSRIPDESGDETEDHRDEVLVTHDFRQAGSTLKNALIDDDLQKLIGRVKTKRLLILVDACHSGTATKGLFTNRYMSDTEGVAKNLVYAGQPNDNF
ncbi:MAG: Caspase domain-containing protein [Candidatus Kentron sp. G]|nr:MAG: Caspase domain-containing protein [Candidatus Kentron sp. G]VFM99424.1 MAG: Caspase domain-containing protein [Candidatus Kentron sp. G]VFN01548.1 MAG: Caspase domain-containing protein [Candidatus Kentron sp. G]